MSTKAVIVIVIQSGHFLMATATCVNSLARGRRSGGCQRNAQVSTVSMELLLVTRVLGKVKCPQTRVLLKKKLNATFYKQITSLPK